MEKISIKKRISEGNPSLPRNCGDYGTDYFVNDSETGDPQMCEIQARNGSETGSSEEEEYGAAWSLAQQRCWQDEDLCVVALSCHFARDVFSMCKASACERLLEDVHTKTGVARHDVPRRVFFFFGQDDEKS